MDRRSFLKFLGAASAGATVVYSFPSIIVPKNIDLINLVTQREIFPKLIDDFFFQETPLFAYLRDSVVMRILDDPEYGFGYVEQNGVWVHEVVKKEESNFEILDSIEDNEPIFFINSKEMNIVPQEKVTKRKLFGFGN